MVGERLARIKDSIESKKNVRKSNRFLQILKKTYANPKNPIKSRKLVFETTRAGTSILVLRGSDVMTYVRHGIADMGMVGKWSSLLCLRGRL